MSTPSGNKNKSQFQRVVITGNPFQRGVSYGSQVKDKILASLEFYQSWKCMPSWDKCRDFCGTHYIPAMRRLCPAALREMEGIAEGTGVGVSLLDILALNARYELSGWSRWLHKNKTPMKDDNDSGQGDCTGGVALGSATCGNKVLMGQTWDLDEVMLKKDLIILLEVHPDPDENIPDFITLTEAGQLARSGMNSAGLGLLGMGMWSSRDDEVFHELYDKGMHGSGWIPLTVSRRRFLESYKFNTGIKVVCSHPRQASMALILGTSEDEALNLELVPGSHWISTVPLEKEVLVHANHFTSSGFLSQQTRVREGYKGVTSFIRERRLLKHLLQRVPSISASDFHDAFRDHVCYPNSICEHVMETKTSGSGSGGDESRSLAMNPAGCTVAAMVYNLTDRSFTLCKGQPCQGDFGEYKLTSTTP